MSHIQKKRVVWFGLLVVALIPTAVMADVSLELKLREMDPHAGQALFLRVVHVETHVEIARFHVPEIQGGSFDLDLSGLQEGSSYRIDFFADVNGNGIYDAPPTDHAWRLELLDVQSDGSLTFTHNTTFTDIGWAPEIDGNILANEYTGERVDSETGMTVYWANTDQVLYIGLVSPGTGWLSIGFEPERMMQGADIIIAGVDGDIVTIEDHYGHSTTGHRLDDLDSIIQAAGAEANGQTILEFAIPLDSGDEQDKALVPGQDVTIILAYHSSSDRLTTRHSERSTTSIRLDD